MSSHEQGEAEHPIWCGAITGHLGATALGLIPRELAIPKGAQLIVELIRSGTLDNLGDLEEHARQDDLPLRLAASPVGLPPIPGAQCLDIRTQEPKPYWLNMLIGDASDHNSEHVKRLSADPTTNIPRLRSETGVWIAGRP
ncbi:MAG TPA: hypothetical protein VLF43_05450 [Candidatus Saccharimonadales bacterium]|nr:hypothetical protein [Candidatus Saccharimonadales bacterium]